jgi:hypothetical protein
MGDDTIEGDEDLYMAYDEHECTYLLLGEQLQPRNRGRRSLTTLRSCLLSYDSANLLSEVIPAETIDAVACPLLSNVVGSKRLGCSEVEGDIRLQE